MKKIFITYPTSLEFWLNVFDPNEYKTFRKENINYSEEISILTISEGKKVANFLKTGLPLSILARDDKSRRNNSVFGCRVVPADTEHMKFVFAGVIFDPGVEVYVADLKYSLLLEAADGKVDEVKLIQDMYLACSTYMIKKEAMFLQINRSALTKVEYLENYFAKYKHIGGGKRALANCNYVIDNSNSPMETSLSIAMLLPFYKGGFGILRPELNGKFDLPQDLVAMVGKSKIICDAVWREMKKVLEYDSRLVHLDNAQHILDKNRATALGMMGIQVITITNGNINSFEKFDNTFRMVRKELKMRNENEKLDKHIEVRRELYSRLFDFKNKETY